jgi:hypothetical protein
MDANTEQFSHPAVLLKEARTYVFDSILACNGSDSVIPGVLQAVGRAYCGLYFKNTAMGRRKKNLYSVCSECAFHFILTVLIHNNKYKYI